MKKYPIFLAVIISAVISCSQEEVLKTDEVKLVPVTIVAESSGFATKTTATLNDTLYNIKWEKGDELSVFAEVDTEIGTEIVTKIDPANRKFIAQQTADLATFTGVLPEGVKSIYPIMPFDEDAHISGSDVYTSIPAEQNGDFYNVVLAGWPRPVTKAEGETDFFYQFEAVSGIIKFHFAPAKIAKCDGKDQHVVRLSITADRPIAGDAKVSFTGGKPVMKADPNGTGSNMYNTITISAPDGAQSLPEGDYYIATLPIIKSDSSDSLAISVKCETKEGEVAYINATIGKAGKDHILTANVVKNIGTVKTTDYVPHFTSGEFTVDASGKKVSFSPGNLQYQASSNTWRFALNQWDAQGEMGNSTAPNNTNGDEGKRATQSEWIDLFPWGHTGWANTTRSYMPYTSDSHPGVYYGNSYSYRDEVDWGKYCDIQNGNNLDLKGTWRVPTLNEFKYMLCLGWSDPGNTGENQGVSNGRIDKVTTDPGQENENQRRRLIFMKLGIRTGVYVGGEEVVRFGLLIFPDGFTWPTALADKKPSRNVYSNKNVAMSLKPIGSQIPAPLYTLSDLVKFEQAGCVFLPAAGYSAPAGYDSKNKIYYVNITDFNMGGYYWSTNKPGFQQFALYAANMSVEHYPSVTKAWSVRLVKDGTGFN